jgi:23S rRNA (cytosine1962-C5)-methyltransferase
MPIPCVIHEDEDLLVVNKPCGWNTHAPDPHAGEGIYDWLRHREPGWAPLAIIHRLDKETSGVMMFSKTPRANRWLTDQFAGRKARKKYILITDRAVARDSFSVASEIVRAGDHYEGRAASAEEKAAVTDFRVIARTPRATTVEALPRTGKTHQIRVHMASRGAPILGDVLYGGTPAARVHLHAAELEFEHPDGSRARFQAPVDWERHPRLALREAFVEPEQTTACRLLHGASDGWPGWYVDRLGSHLCSQSENALSSAQRDWLASLVQTCGAEGAYHKTLVRQIRQTASSEVAPLCVMGVPAPDRAVIRENGLLYGIRFTEGYSVGLFLDQRDNRRRLLSKNAGGDFPLLPPGTMHFAVLNTFAYTCGFSVCAAAAGAATTSLDLSPKYLEWGRDNFRLNGLDPGAHEFLHGDIFDWLKRLAKKKRQFDLVILDPPTFSSSKAGGVFRADRDYGALAEAAMAVLRPGGVLLASTNAAKLEPKRFLQSILDAAGARRRTVLQQRYFPQPPDFPISREEPAYLKTAWFKVSGESQGG